MDINYDYYKVFYEVAKCKNITAAGRRLCLTQPTISKYIQNLEQDLKCQLFVRSQKGVTLTAEGELLYRQVGRACQQMERAQGILKEFVNCQSGIISIGASELTMRYFLLPHLERFRRQFPNVRIQIHTNSTPDSVSALSSGTIDFSLLTTPLYGFSHFQITPVSEFQDVVIAGSQYTYLQDQVLSLKDLLSYPIVCMEKGTSTRKFWDHLFKSRQLELTPSIEVNSNDLIPPTVLHNLGIGFAPYKFSRPYLLNYGLLQLELNIQIPKRHICIVQNQERPLSPASQALVAMLKEANEDSVSVPGAHYSSDQDVAF